MSDLDRKCAPRLVKVALFVIATLLTAATLSFVFVPDEPLQATSPDGAAERELAVLLAPTTPTTRSPVLAGSQPVRRGGVGDD